MFHESIAAIYYHNLIIQKQEAETNCLDFLLYNENPALGAGGSEALLAMGQDKKTPFDVE